MTVLGTRPEIIRLSRVIAALDQHMDHVLVHTGQNYDYELNQLFFEDLELRQPDHFLEAHGDTPAETVAKVISSVDRVMAEVKPEAVLILGDTNSSLAAYPAKRRKIPVFHMEAGNRCFDSNVPEEINRRIVDHISDFNLVYTEHARRHLLSEGLPQRRIYLTGSPMKEVLTTYQGGIQKSTVLRELNLDRRGYFLVSFHREENVDNSENLNRLLAALNALSDRWNLPVEVSTHPRTRNRLERLDQVQFADRVRFHEPFGYFDFVLLQQHALCVISDSGTIAEESAILGFPSITVRNSIERPEALDAGSIVMPGLDSEAIVKAVEVQIAATEAGHEPKIPWEYEVNDTSYRVVKLILGLTHVSHLWDGIRPNDLG